MLFDIIFELLTSWFASTGKDKDKRGNYAIFFLYFTLGFLLLVSVLFAFLMSQLSLGQYAVWIVYLSLAIWGLVGLGCFIRALVKKRLDQAFWVLLIVIMTGSLVSIFGQGA